MLYMLVISVVERYFRLILKYLLPLKKVLFTVYKLPYCTNYIHSLLQHIHKFTLNIYK